MKLTKAMKALMGRETDVATKYVMALVLAYNAVQMGLSPTIVTRFSAIAERYRQEDDALIAELDAMAEDEGE